MRRRARWAGWLIRRAAFDANPLHRRIDRAEAWIRLGLIGVFLIAGPLAAIAVGHWASASAASTAHAQAAAKYRVQAVLVRSAPTASVYPGGGRAGPASVLARWTAPDGTAHTGNVLTVAGADAGSAVTVWADASGALTDPPMGRSEILSRVITFVAVTPAILAIALLNILWVTHRVLDRRRLAAWETGWSAVGPQWTRQY